MKTFKLILTKRQGHLLRTNLEGAAKGYSRRDLRQLDRLADEMEEMCVDFMDQCNALMRESKRRVRDGEAQSSVQEEYDLEQRELNEGIGSKVIEFEVAQTDFEWLKRKWYDLDNFSGAHEVRKVVIAIDDAFTEAEKRAIEQKMETEHQD